MSDCVLVLCMKWGQIYGPEYVNNLARGVRRNLKRPYRFLCFTDDSSGLSEDIEVYHLPDLGLPAECKDRRWQKLALFQKDLFGLSGQALFLDLDLVIVGSLDDFFEVEGSFLIIRDDDLFRPKILRKLNPTRDGFLHMVGNSSVFRFEIGTHSYILDEFLRSPELAMKSYEISQQFQSAQVAMRGKLDYWPKGWCVSFKNDCVGWGFRSYWQDPVIPSEARIVVFAGAPKMGEVLAGGGSKWYRHIGNIDWLKEAWCV